MTNTISAAEILEYLRAFPEDTFTEVARGLNIERHKVSSLAHKNGLYRLPRRAKIMRHSAEIATYLKTHPEESHDNVGGRFGSRASSASHLASKSYVRTVGTDLEAERMVVGYIQSHPKESYSAMGKHLGCSPGRLSQIARGHGIIRYAQRGQGEKKRQKILKYLRKHTDVQVIENAKRLGISPAYVSTIATRHGLRRQAPKGSGLSIIGRVVRSNGIRPVPLAPAPTLVRQPPTHRDLDRKIQLAEQKLHELRARKASLETHLEVDGEIITIYGIGEPIARHRSDWLRWLKGAGAAELRERCSKEQR